MDYAFFLHLFFFFLSLAELSEMHFNFYTSNKVLFFNLSKKLNLAYVYVRAETLNLF